MSRERSSPLLWVLAAAVIGSVAAVVPFQMWAQSPIGVIHPTRLFYIGLAVWILAFAALIVLHRLGVALVVATAGVSAAVYVLMRGSGLVHRFGYWVAIGLGTVVISIVMFLMARRDSSRGVWFFLGAASIVLLAQPITTAVDARSSLGTDRLVSGPGLGSVELVEKPDIQVVVVDAYPSRQTLDTEFGMDTDAWGGRFETAGLTIVDSAWSPYPNTRAAIPALMDMTYPLHEGPGIEPATTRSLYEMIAGENELVRILSSNGYEITMIESGWSGSKCGHNIDHCVEAPFLDEATFFALNETMAGPAILETYGYSFTVGAKSAMAWLSDNAERLESNSVPDLVLTHLEIPHPPMFLDRNCELRYSASASGVTLVRPNDDADERKKLFLDQLACLDGFLIEFAQNVDSETLMVFVGDHGTDIHNQLVVHPQDWSPEAVSERLGVFLAIRVSQGCQIGSSVVLPNLMRRILTCVGSHPIPDVPDRLYKYAGVSFNGEPSPIVRVDDTLTTKLIKGD